MQQPQERLPKSSGNTHSAPTSRPRWIAGAIKLALVSVFIFVTGGPAVMAQFDESNPAVYWRLERARQNQIKEGRVRRRVIIQRPTRLIRRARPRRGYTIAVPDTHYRAPGESPITAKQNELQTPPSAPATPALAAPAIAGAEQPAEASSAPTAAKLSPPPAAAAPVLRVAVLGDNLASQLARGLEATYDKTPQIEILRLAKDNSGLVRNDYYDWTEATKALLARGQKIDIAIMMIGSNDRQSIRDSSGAHPPRSEAWNKLYAARIEAIATQFRQKKIPLIWLGMPVMRSEKLSVDMLAFNQLYRNAAQKNGAKFVDLWEGFLDERNRFTLYGPDVNGETVKLRVSDGVHFTRAGARKLAHFAAIDIKRLIDKRRLAGTGAAFAGLDPTGPAAPAGTEKSTPTQGLQASLPKPAAPAKVFIPVKPVAGPVLELTALPLAPDGELATRSKPNRRSPGTQGSLPSVLTSGRPPNAKPGRADDFRWPRP